MLVSTVVGFSSSRQTSNKNISAKQNNKDYQNNLISQTSTHHKKSVPVKQNSQKLSILA